MKVKSLVLSLMLFFAASVSASPHQQEKLEFCKTVAGNYKAGQDAKALKMPQDELEARLLAFMMGLMQNGMPEPLIKLLVMPIIDGYTGQSSAEVHFNRCMTSELI
jgi:hypothetical protein